MSDTPETDAAWLEQKDMVLLCRKLERERDEAREKMARQSDRIRYLEGATNHAEGTPLSIALKERDEAREKYNNLATEHMLVVNKLAGERDEARAGREAYKQLAVKHAQERGAAREEVKLLQAILDIIRKDSQ